MKGTNVRLIFFRELRDQLRDRRTVFTIAVLPIMLYPLLGISLLQVAQFRKEHPTRIWVLGDLSDPRILKAQDADESPTTTAPADSPEASPTAAASSDPSDSETAADRRTPAGVDTPGQADSHRTLTPLLQITAEETTDEARFAEQYCETVSQDLLEITLAPATAPELNAALKQLVESATLDAQGEFPELDIREAREQIDKALKARQLDCLLYMLPATPQGAGDSLEVRESSDEASPESDERPRFLLLTNSARDKSVIASQRVDDVLESFREALVTRRLAAQKLPQDVLQPVQWVTRDVAAEKSKRAAIWSKILPFVVLIWALTGAFYPAIDLCAGEKERGTLETLLSSPAKRVEIVYGKLLTIMVFSMSTAALNMASMVLTGTLFIAQMSSMGLPGSLSIGPPPPMSLVWLLLAMLPVSALFSALSLAIAAFARSSKEGQYYLMPLLMITLPLMLLPVLPTAELDLGTSLIPVTGMLLLLRALIEGEYSEAFRFALPVLGVTLGCCLFAVRWAVDQFNNESVLFRASERLGLGVWLRHMIRDRSAMPTMSEAFLCGFIILLAKFFGSLVAGEMPTTWNDFVVMTVVALVALVAMPALLMAIMLTRRPAQSLLLALPRPVRARDRWGWWLTLPGAALLAICLHPAIVYLSQIVIDLYPVSEELAALDSQLAELAANAPGLWAVLAVFALTPAVCEELAFRGFMLTGMYSPGRKWRAILITAAFFGATHGLLQQSIVAGFTGLILGYVAVQTRSIFPCMIYHFTHNALPLSYRPLTPLQVENSPTLDWLFDFTAGANGEAMIHYAPLAATLLVLTGLVLLGLLSRLRVVTPGIDSSPTVDLSEFSEGFSVGAEVASDTADPGTQPISLASGSSTKAQ